MEKETKIKMRMCSACGKEFNIYTRPLIARFTCSEECREIQRAKRQELLRETKKQAREVNRQRIKRNLIIMLIIGLITGIIGAVVGGYIYNAMGMIGNRGMVILIGFGLGFLVPFVFYICDNY